MRNKYKKYADKIHEKYLGKTQYAIQVLNSCKTGEQTDVCFKWALSLFNQWLRYETRIIEETHGGFVMCKMIFTVQHEFLKLIDMFELATDRKNTELSKN